MADPRPSSPAILASNPQYSNPESNNLNQQPDPSSQPDSSTPSTSNSSPYAPTVSLQPPMMTSYTSPPISGATTAVPPAMPSFRPVQQFPPFLSYPTPGVPPPGVSSSPAVPPGSAPIPMMQYQIPPGHSQNPALRPFAPNGYAAMPGLPRYPSPYPAMVRPMFPPRPPGAVGVIPGGLRPPFGIPGVRPIFPPFVRPGVTPIVTPAEKPQTTVYIGKIAPTVDNDFMLSLLRICGPVKSWKRAQDPTDGTPRAFGFCEFESAEGVLSALRLLTKFNIDGQELSINVNEATKKYLGQYVQKKAETAKNLNETEAGRDEKDVGNEAGSEKNEHSTASAEDTKKDDEDLGKKSFLDIANSGIVTDQDREADKQSLEKLNSLIEERLKTNPLPPPPPLPPLGGSMKLNSEVPDSDGDGTQSDGAEGKKDEEEHTSGSKTATENEKPESSSPVHRNDRRNRDKEQNLKRENEREIERLERVTERERTRKEKELKRKIDDAEREYQKYLRDWEQREKEKEKQRHYEKNREKERERKRKKEIRYDEEDDDDEDSRKRYRRSELEEKRRKRLQEKEEDLADRVKEEEENAEKEIAEAQKRADEEQVLQQQREALRLLSNRVSNGGEKTVLAEESTIQSKGNGNLQNSEADESNLGAIAASDARQGGNAPARKLGFGLVGSGKRTNVPSVFHEEEDDAHKDKKLRPLVPIDYTNDEIQGIQSTDSGVPSPNLAAAAEFAKRISNTNPKEEKHDRERERSRRSHDKSSRGKDRNDREHGRGKVNAPENQKLFDAKQLIDMIPKTKEELFAYEVNWDVYDKHALHERMRPWISKKIAEFLGEEEKTLVDYIVSSTQEHVKATQMLELLQSILDEEAEMFVLKMWRMLIFEIKKVETGIALPQRA